jgi:Spy/CpxP family protein refolding chaperone
MVPLFFIHLNAGDFSMKPRNVIAMLSLLLVFTLPMISQTSDINQIVNDPKRQDEVIAALSGNHELLMKLIDKLSEHPHFAQMMKDRFGGAAQADEHSAYAGQEVRSIKALSEEQIKQYLAGEGMGFAKPAELNEYPGPRHVLDLASQLKLNDRAKQRIADAYDAMHSEAIRLGMLIVAREKNLDSLFASRRITSAELKKKVDEIGRLEGALRSTHLDAHLKTAALLTHEQIESYKKLRGYVGGAMQHEHQD